ncbi:MAG: acyl-CoA thioesterase [Saprospiraceae bacterium]|nr:acyl-CoA thioesterase [Saprospiraceae bacterium]MBK8484776.1 acyl-CoA thioesterase [Saprospiraceae bacterium]MBK9222168.1 acyl-CoA thioesterase [Saprospiraceae bacterium]MBK9720922.1 acyl-CoA thioesterase [Saprospiraceae bacterium]MBK9727916.1 acyl-CoA thioesterase [Saprospiraceae bacterium]
MYKHEFQIRVRYSETDKMGFVYYGNYMQYYEVGRVEALRNLGIRYADLEDEFGIIMPVVNMNVRYLRPAYYDELITMQTHISQLPETSIKFNTEIYNMQKQLLNAAQITLCFLDAKTKSRLHIPQNILDKLIPYFEKV